MKQMNIARLLPRLKEIKLTSNTHYIKLDHHLSASFSSYLFPLLTSVKDSKTMSSHRVSTSPAEVKDDERQQKQAMMKCPRCDSPNTKFCYYNNYSLAQPRHFCKTCRRYWTKGGALRNVPIGGGCRKNKKAKSSSRESGSSSSGLDGLKFFHELSPAMEFQHLGGLSYPRLNVPLAPKNCYNHISPFGDPSAPSATGSSSSCSFSLDPSGSSNALMGFHYLPVENINSFNAQTSLGTSIESLSYLNQDLHWKLQQQRLATLLVGDGSQRDITRDVASMPIENQTQKLQRPIVFQNLDGSKLDVSSSGEAIKEGTCGDTSTGMYFGNSHTIQPMNIVGTGNKNAISGSSWSGIQSWTDLHQFQGLH